MNSEETVDRSSELLIPEPNYWLFRLIFGGLFLTISTLGLYYSVRGILKYGFAWDSYGTSYLFGLICSPPAIFVQRAHEFAKQDSSMSTYWAIGLPIKNLFKKLPWIWREYSGKRISGLKVYRMSKADREDPTGRTKILTYHVKAKIGRKMIYLVHYSKLERALDVAWEIGQFIGVPVDDSSL